MRTVLSCIFSFVLLVGLRFSLWALPPTPGGIFCQEDIFCRINMSLNTLYDSFTVQLWIKPYDESDSALERFIVGQELSTNHRWTISLQGNVLRVYFIRPTPPANTVVEYTIPNYVSKQWYNVALRVNALANNYTLFIDGQPVQSGTANWSGAMVTTPLILFRGTYAPLGHFYGQIDDVRFSNLVLTNTDILNDLSSPVVTLPSSNTAFLPFTDNGGNTAVNQGGLGGSAILTGAGYWWVNRVENTMADGVGSFAFAIARSNANASSRHYIDFSIPASDPGYNGTYWTIKPTSTLTCIGPVWIDGYSQMGSRVNTQSIGQPLNTILTVEISGENTDQNIATSGNLLFAAGADSSVVSGLAINRYNHVGSSPAGKGKIYINDADNVTVWGCFLGVAPDGLTTFEETINSHGVVTTASNTRIGLGIPKGVNVISGNGGYGVFHNDLLNTGGGLLVQGNYIGTGSGFFTSIGNGRAGIALISFFTDIADNIVGGLFYDERNIIAYNGDLGGIYVSANNKVVEVLALNNLLYCNVGGAYNLPTFASGGDGYLNIPTISGYSELNEQLSGTGVPGATIEVYLDYTECAFLTGIYQGILYKGSTTVAPDGTWVFNYGPLEGFGAITVVQNNGVQTSRFSQGFLLGGTPEYYAIQGDMLNWEDVSTWVDDGGSPMGSTPIPYSRVFIGAGSTVHVNNAASIAGQRIRVDNGGALRLNAMPSSPLQLTLNGELQIAYPGPATIPDFSNLEGNTGRFAFIADEDYTLPSAWNWQMPLVIRADGGAHLLSSGNLFVNELQIQNGSALFTNNMFFQNLIVHGTSTYANVNNITSIGNLLQVASGATANMGILHVSNAIFDIQGELNVDHSLVLNGNVQLQGSMRISSNSNLPESIISNGRYIDMSTPSSQLFWYIGSQAFTYLPLGLGAIHSLEASVLPQVAGELVFSLSLFTSLPSPPAHTDASQLALGIRSDQGATSVSIRLRSNNISSDPLSTIIYRFDVGSGQWIPLSTTYDQSSQSYTANTSVGTELSYFALVSMAPSIDIITTVLPNARVGEPYSFDLQAAGGVAPYVYTLVEGTLPDGLILQDNGRISNVPTRAGTYSFGVRVVDQNAAFGMALLQLQVERGLSQVNLQSISIEIVDNSTYRLSGSTQVGQPLSFASTNPQVALVQQVNASLYEVRLLNNNGTADIEAYFAGDADYEPSSSVVVMRIQANRVVTASDQSFTSTWQLYPNPASHLIYVYNAAGQRPATYSVYDVSGRAYTVLPADGGFYVGHLPPGIYMIRVNDRSEQQWLRFVKQ